MSNRDADRRVRRHRVPEWWRDAKLGIFVHWTPASVPAFAPTGETVGELLAAGNRHALAHSPYAEWYENSLRFPDSPVSRHHADEYGTRPYAEFARDWEAALVGWDPDAWAARFAATGAGYVVLVAKHHDGYCLWPSDVRNPHRADWECRRDVVGEIAEAVRSRGMRFGLYYSGGLDWTWNDRPIGTFSDLPLALPRGDYPAYAVAQVRELIDRYRPSVLWNDISWPTRSSGLARLLAHYYATVPDGVINDRFLCWSPAWELARVRMLRRGLDRVVAAAARQGKGVIPPKPRYFDVRTPEYTVFDTIQRTPWECVRGMDESFGHNRVSTETDFISQRDLLWSLVDITAKGGNLLLNVGPRGEDATIADAQVRRLDWLSSFTGASGTALFGTRPWTRAAEPSSGEADVRYTTRGDTVFAIARGLATTELMLSEMSGTPATRVTSLGGTELVSRAAYGGLVVELDVPLSPDVPSAFRTETTHS